MTTTELTQLDKDIKFYEEHLKWLKQRFPKEADYFCKVQILNNIQETEETLNELRAQRENDSFYDKACRVAGVAFMAALTYKAIKWIVSD